MCPLCRARLRWATSRAQSGTFWLLLRVINPLPFFLYTHTHTQTRTPPPQSSSSLALPRPFCALDGYTGSFALRSNNSLCLAAQPASSTDPWWLYLTACKETLNPAQLVPHASTPCPARPSRAPPPLTHTCATTTTTLPRHTPQACRAAMTKRGAGQWVASRRTASAFQTLRS